MKKSKIKNQAKSDKLLIKSMLIGSGAGTVAFFTFIGLFAFIIFKKDTPENYYPAFLISASGISAFISGFLSVLPIKRNGLILGIFSTIPVFFIIFVASSIINRAGISLYGWISFAIMTILGAVGGIISANTKRKIK